jgi:hypothetical protein
MYYNEPRKLDRNREIIRWTAPPCRTERRRHRVSYEKVVRKRVQGQSSLGSPQGRENLAEIVDYLLGPSEYDCPLEETAYGACIDAL